MAKIYLLTILLFISNLINAQVPGYQGKQFSIHYNNLFMSALKSPNLNGNTGPGVFNTTHHFSFDYVISRKIAFGLDYFRFKTKLDFESQSIKGNDVHFDKYGDLSVNGIGLHFKRFYGDNLAPLGKYLAVEIIDYIQTVSYDKNLFNEQNPNLGNLSDDGPFHSVAFCLSFGNQRIFYNRFILDIGIQTGLTVRDIENIGPQNVSPDITTQNYLRQITTTRVFTHSFLNLNVGFGILLF